MAKRRMSYGATVKAKVAIAAIKQQQLAMLDSSGVECDHQMILREIQNLPNTVSRFGFLLRTLGKEACHRGIFN
jgi:hypothetical protein